MQTIESVCFCVSVSKQQAIMPGQSYELEDGSSSFKDFHGSRNNRFSSPEQAAKNRIQHPSNVLHFFNAAPESTPESFTRVRSHYRKSGPFLSHDGIWCVHLQPSSVFRSVKNLE